VLGDWIPTSLFVCPSYCPSQFGINNVQSLSQPLFHKTALKEQYMDAIERQEQDLLVEDEHIGKMHVLRPICETSL